MIDTSRVGALYSVTRAGSPVDLMVYLVVGPLTRYRSGKFYVRHEYLLTWGLDGEGHMVRRESWDDAEIKAFVRRARKSKGLKLRSIWDSRSGQLPPQELVVQARPRQLDFN